MSRNELDKNLLMIQKDPKHLITLFNQLSSRGKVNVIDSLKINLELEEKYNNNSNFPKSNIIHFSLVKKEGKNE